MATKSKTLHLTVLSAEDLRVNGKPADKNVFVAVRAESITTHTTAMNDNNGGGFHTWNEKFMVELGVHARSITFEVKCKTKFGAIKDVGIARIAISDFLGGLVPDSSLQFLSYRLRDWNGHRNGIINFSVRVVSPPTADNVVGGTCRVLAGVNTSSSSSSNNGMVVTGIPVWWNSSTSTTNF